MIITDIIEYSKAKYKIFIDNEFAFVLYKGELRQFKLKKDEEINVSTYQEIMGTVLPKRAKLRAMHLLEKRPYTEKAMRDKLRDGQFSTEIIDEAIDYLKGYKYIDDYNYALQYIDTYTECRSVRKIEQELKQKGIKSDIITKAISDRRDEGELGDERKMIRSLLEKKHYSPDMADAKEKNKIMNYLFNKGFSIDNIRREMNCNNDYDYS